MYTLGIIDYLSKFNQLLKHRKIKRGLSTIVTSAILLSAVSVLGIGIISWANSNLQTHQAQLDQTFADNHNKINEKILIEHVWFGNTGPSINVTMSNVGTLGLNVTQLRIQDIDSGQYYTYPTINTSYTDGGIVSGGDLSLNETLNWIPGSPNPYHVEIITNRGNIFSIEVLSP